MSAEKLPLYQEIDNLRAHNEQLREDCADLYVKLLEVNFLLEDVLREEKETAALLFAEITRLRKQLGECE